MREPETSTNILLTEASACSRELVATLSRTGEVTALDVKIFSHHLAELREAQVLWVRLAHFIGPDVFNLTPQLMVIASPTTGLNHIDLTEAARRNVKVLSLRGEVEFLRGLRATAELTLGLLIALMRKIPSSVSSARSGEWRRENHVGSELAGKTAGIIGMGRLGTMVARYLFALDMKVLVTDPFISDEEVPDFVERTDLDELLARCDVISIHASVEADAPPILGRREFALMRHGCWLVNTARGELIDESCLLQALETGRMTGAAIDVYEREQLREWKGSPLHRYFTEHNNLLVTPHIGGLTVESAMKAELFLAERLRGFLLESPTRRFGG